MTPQGAGPDIVQEDVEAIVALVARFEHARQNALPDAFLELFRRDALCSTPYGTALSGIDEIGDFARRVLPETAVQPLTSAVEMEYIHFLRPDVAAVMIRHRPVTRDGEPLDALLHRGRDGRKRSRCRKPSEVACRWASPVAAHPGAAPGADLHVMTRTDGRWLTAVAQDTTAPEVDPSIG
ncbi:SgcJ/EcaC family oxidoreductase [Kitasatospora sp. NPDC050543]|uniref:SgcJ/EcaC family oxidoreductase n=1 Tax=Kitasatospora sp. NPDC050543 TaxID=3364054 RepID=UPI00379E4BC1